MEDVDTRIEDIFKKSKLRVTQSRRDILQIFLDAPHAISNSDIEGKMDEVDRITLYRTLRTFEDKAVIHAVNDGTGQTKYALCDIECTDDNHHHHDHVHFHCTNCASTYCVDEVRVPSVDLPQGYKVQDVELILKGLCNNCSK